jgi:hypothetical protein
LPIFGYLALRDRRALVTSSLTSAILLIGFAGFSEINYGSYLPPYYFASRLSADHSLPALVALVFSPSRGVLIFNPFLFAALAFARYAKSVRNPLVLISLATTMLAQFASNVFFPHWTGGESYGPRILANLVLTGCIITISLLEAMPENTRRASTWYLVATLSVGMCVNMPGLISKYTMLWNEFPPIDFDPWIVWDWKFPQFLSYSKSRVRLKCLEQSRTLSRATQQLCQNIQ